MNERPLFAVDIGNTRTKICFWSNPNISRAEKPDSNRRSCFSSFDVEITDSSANYAEARACLVSLNIASKSCLWVVSSVNDAKTKVLKELVNESRANDQFITLTHDDVPIELAYDDPNKLGMDRMIAAFSGLRVVGRGVPFLVVDVGTAATVDYVDSKGVFRGGAILPGPTLSAEALNARTAQLPLLLDWDDEPRDRAPICLPTYPATETFSGIRLGVSFALVGAIVSFYWNTRRRVENCNGDSSRLAILLSGGNARSTACNLNKFFDDLDACLSSSPRRPEIIVEPRLIIEGLFELASSLSY